MKKILTILLLFLALATGARAQFEEGTKYVGAQLSALNLNFSDKAGFRVALNANGGYFFADGWMAHGTVGFEHFARNSDRFTIGGGLRYHFYENGLTLGTGLEYTHLSPNINDLRVPVELGYVYYLNHYLAIEPVVYYKLSVNDVVKGSEVGFRIGLGYYF